MARNAGHCVLRQLANCPFEPLVGRLSEMRQLIFCVSCADNAQSATIAYGFWLNRQKLCHWFYGHDS